MHWSQRITVILLTLFLMMYVVPVGAATNEAVTYETISAPRVPDGVETSLGRVAVRINPLLDMDHEVYVSLPKDFVIKEVSVTRARYAGTDLEFSIDGEEGSVPVEAEPDSDEFVLRIPSQGEINTEVEIFISFDLVEIPLGYRGDIMVSFNGIKGQFPSGTTRSGMVPGRVVEEPEEVDDPEEPEPPEEIEEPEEPVEPAPPEEPEPPEEVLYGARRAFLTIGSETATIDGVRKEMDVAPFIRNGHTFVPVRFLAEAFGAAADWEPKDAAVEQVFLTRGDRQITITIGEAGLSVLEDGEERTVTAEAASFIENGRTFLPFRAVAEAFGAEVSYGPPEGPVQWVYFEQ